MSKRSPARIPYIPLFGTIAQFQLNTPPVSVLCHPRAVLCGGTVRFVKPHCIPTVWVVYSAVSQAALCSHCV